MMDSEKKMCVGQTAKTIWETSLSDIFICVMSQALEEKVIKIKLMNVALIN